MIIWWLVLAMFIFVVIDCTLFGNALDRMSSEQFKLYLTKPRWLRLSFGSGFYLSFRGFFNGK